MTCPCLFGSGPTEEFCEESSLLEVEKGHYGNVGLDGLAAVVTYRAGKFTRIYVADTATSERADAFSSVVSLTIPFLGMGPVEVVIGANANPIKLEDFPAKGLPFPEAHDRTQYKSVLSKDDSEAHHFEWSGRTGES